MEFVNRGRTVQGPGVTVTPQSSVSGVQGPEKSLEIPSTYRRILLLWTLVENKPTNLRSNLYSVSFLQCL